jgi:hypothetical protein
MRDLCEVLQQMIVLLEEEGLGFGRDWIEHAYERLRHGDARGLDLLLGAYNIRGHLDLGIGALAAPGPSADPPRRRQELERLSAAAWSLAHELRQRRRLGGRLATMTPMELRGALAAIGLAMLTLIGAGLGLLSSLAKP